MKKITLLLVTIIASIKGYSQSKDFLPSTIYQLDQKFTHHILVVEKATHSLFLYRYGEDKPELLKKFKILTGKYTGNKMVQGDKKTPEGIYFFQKFHSSDYLIKKYGEYGRIYGAGAFTTNYPNIIDKRKGKTGGGIWLHSTDDDNRVSLGLDSKGCVVAVDEDLKDISQYIDLSNTPIIIVQNLHFQTKENWETNKEQILSTVQNWMTAWKEKDFDQYINSYSKQEFVHPRRGRFSAYKQYKRSVFARADKPQITFTNLSLLHNGEYVVATMVQNYDSPVISDIGKKTLYLKKDKDYQWKIVWEEWSKLHEEQINIAFTPKMRYFTDQQLTSKDMRNDSGSI